MKVGDRVRYWAGVKRGEPTGTGVIRFLAMMGDTEVAWLSSRPDCIALTHLELVEPNEVDGARDLRPVTRPRVTKKPPRKLEPIVKRYELIGLQDGEEKCLGWCASWMEARGELRTATRSDALADAWIVDHGGPFPRIYDLQRERTRRGA